jgi:hypothetical protein
MRGMENVKFREQVSETNLRLHLMKQRGRGRWRKLRSEEFCDLY